MTWEFLFSGYATTSQMSQLSLQRSSEAWLFYTTAIMIILYRQQTIKELISLSFLVCAFAGCIWHEQELSWCGHVLLYSSLWRTLRAVFNNVWTLQRLRLLQTRNSSQITVMSLRFQTDRSGQTVSTQIRLLLEEQTAPRRAVWSETNF